MENMENENIKQVIVVRRDLLNPLEFFAGKMMAQVGHAVSLSLLSNMNVEKIDNREKLILELDKNSSIYKWIYGDYKKIIVYVDSEKELIKVYNKALKRNLNAVLVKDNGLTAYEPGTYTCCGIGPAPHKKFNGVTNHLSIKFEEGE